jgi:hypothetical protein
LSTDAAHYKAAANVVQRAIVSAMADDPPPVFVVMPGDIATYYDDRFPLTTGKKGNQVAVVVDENGALCLGKGICGRRVERIPLQSISKLHNAEFHRPVAIDGEKLAQFFLRYAKHPSYFEAGIRAIRCHNWQPFHMGDLFPRRPHYNDDQEYDAAWNQFTALLQPLDCIYTVDQTIRLSRFIAWATHGPWSHVAVYVGSGEIQESVTSGVRQAPLETYRGRQYWIAAYRHIELVEKPVSEQKAREPVLRFNRDNYNYRGAAMAGIRAFFNNHARGDTPNSSIYLGNRVFIGQV